MLLFVGHSFFNRFQCVNLHVCDFAISYLLIQRDLRGSTTFFFNDKCSERARARLCAYYIQNTIDNNKCKHMMQVAT